MESEIYLIPVFLHDDEIAMQCIPANILKEIKKCSVFYVENERTARRYLKKIWKEINIDAFQWHTIHKAEKDVLNLFINDILQHKTIGIMSEAGCPGIADPGQLLIHAAQTHNAKIIPLVGPNSIILALMASGLNGQHFSFVGYLPVDSGERKRKIIDLENESAKKNCTQVFIETPYRNDQLFNDILNTAKPDTLLCIGVDITSADEIIKTKKIKEWRKSKPVLNKRQVVFLLYSGIN